MSAEENKAIIRRAFEDILNNGKLDELSEIIAPTYVNHDMPMREPGPAGMREVLQPFLTGFPDFHVTIEDMVAEGDKVATRGVFTGTHRAEFMGVPASGKQVRIAY